MEGIRRIGVALKVLGAIWLLALLLAAAYNAVGDEVPISDQDKAMIYQKDTGKDLEAEAEAHTAWPNGRPETLLAMAEAIPAREKILTEHFANQPTVFRRYDWGSAMVCVAFGLVGSAILVTLGWIVTGFAVKRV